MSRRYENAEISRFFVSARISNVRDRCRRGRDRHRVVSIMLRHALPLYRRCSLTYHFSPRSFSAVPTSPASGVPRCNAPTGTSGELRFDDTARVFAGRSMHSLIHALVIFRLCTLRSLVARAPTLLAASRAVLGDAITAAALRATFFAHFCAGENEAALAPALKRLQSAGVGAILDYAAESEGGSIARGHDAFDKNAAASLRCVRAAGGGGSAAVKLTSLAAPDLLERVSMQLQRQRRAYRRFNADAAANPYAVVIDASAFERAVAGPSLAAADARDVFALLDTNGDGRVDFLDWFAFCAMLMGGGAEAAAAAAAARRGCTPAALLDILAPPQLGALDVGLTAGERADWRAALGRVHALAAAAAEAGSTVMIDAEQSYLQYAIDWAAVSAQRRFNRPHVAGAPPWLPPEAAAVWRSTAARASQQTHWPRCGVAGRFGSCSSGGATAGRARARRRFQHAPSVPR